MGRLKRFPLVAEREDIFKIGGVMKNRIDRGIEAIAELNAYPPEDLVGVQIRIDKVVLILRQINDILKTCERDLR